MILVEYYKFNQSTKDEKINEIKFSLKRKIEKTNSLAFSNWNNAENNKPKKSILKNAFDLHVKATFSLKCAAKRYSLLPQFVQSKFGKEVLAIEKNIK